MVQFLSPEVRAIELESKVRNIRAVSTSIGAVIGIMEKGPIAKPVPITSFEEFLRIFGGPIADGQAYWAVKGFFENSGEGTVIWVCRTAHYTTISDPSSLTATSAFLTIKDQGGTNDTLTVEATNEGEWGNALQVTVQANSRFTYATTTELTDNGTSVGLDQIDGVRVGSVIELDDGVDSVSVVVRRRENLTIFFDDVGTLTGPIAIGASAIEKSFDLIVFQAGEEIERHEFLSMEDTNSRDFVEKRINDLADTQRSTIRVTDEDTATTDPSDQIPIATSQVFLAGGTNGLTGLTDGDFAGNIGAGNGIYALDSVDTVNMIAIPESQTQVVQQAVIDYCERRRFPLGIISSPLSLNVTGVIAHVNTTLAANTSRTAFFYPQLKVYDADADGTRIVPADAHIMGIYARVDQNIGVQQVGAGEYGQLRGAVGFESEFAQKKGNRDLLYPQNINALANIPSLGRVVFGSRTLSKSGGIGTQINERRVFNLVEESLERSMQWVLFKLNTEELRKSVFDTISAFLGILKSNGVLEDFLVDVGEGLNNALVQESGKLVAAVALRVAKTIEFFEIQVTKDTRSQEAAIAELAA